VVDRPAATDEVANAQYRHREEHDAEGSVQEEPYLTVGEEPSHRRNGAIGVREAKLSHSVGALPARPP
jgi:hypothetical protein